MSGLKTIGDRMNGKKKGSDELMPYQVPKADHPWRQYTNRIVEDGRRKKELGKSVKDFISEMAESWDTVEIVTTAYSKFGKFYLNELPRRNQAAWLAGLLKRNYG